MTSLRKRGRASALTLTLSAGLVASLAALGTTGASAQSSARASKPAAVPLAVTGCDLGHGIKHVIEITFDNVHFFRDNPNVPSDIEMLPALEHFIEDNGVLLSNNHTPLIAHTADDTLTTYTGLYGDRAGMPVSNDYRSYNGDGTTDLDGSFAYWTDPIYDETSPADKTADTAPSMVYSATPPATTPGGVKPDEETPAPWAQFTRAGCNVGEVATTNMELENASYDIPEVFGPNSPEAKQLNADSDPYKDPEVADYIGLAVHCAKGSAVCANAEAVKYGESKPSHTAVSDLLPDEPGGYTGYQALFGHKYIAPVMGAGKKNLKRNGYEITDSAGNLVDLDGNQINGAYVTNYPGFPGYDSINAAQTLAYMADMEESGVPVTYGYISDLHGNEYIPSLKVCDDAPSALPSGSPCYVAQAQYYNNAFEMFFKRLAADGITAKNSLFIISSDEGDHEAGANVGRAIQPTPANCDGAVVKGDTVKPGTYCTYPKGTFGELDVDLTGLLAKQAPKDKVQYSIEDDTAPEFYINDNPGSDTASVRELEHDVAKLKVPDVYSGKGEYPLANYIADPAEEAILHMVNADPRRTPTFSVFARPDYYIQSGSCSGSCVYVDDSYAWDHGDYAPEIDSNYVGFVGPGVRHLGLDGWNASQGPNSAGPNSGQGTVPAEHNPGPWVDETDIQPTIMFLCELKDPYTPDGRVVTQILATKPATLAPAYVTELGEVFKQVNSSVGEFGTYTLDASTHAVDSTTTGDDEYLQTNQALASLDQDRDFLTAEIKSELVGAEFGHTVINQATARAQIGFANFLIASAYSLAAHTRASVAAAVNHQLAPRFSAFKLAD